MAIGHYILEALRTIMYLKGLALKEGLVNPYKELREVRSNAVYALGNGPSLKDFLEEVETHPEAYKNDDFSVVNDFVHDHRFELIKPKYYVLSDPLFFKDTLYSERGHNVDEALAHKVNWDMYLFIPCIYEHSAYLHSIRKNSHIHIIVFHTMRYAGALRLRNWFFKRGIGNGEYGTVVLNQLYSLLMLGYKRLYVYGIDHTFFSSIEVNSDNVLCTKVQHFYSKEVELKPMMRHYENKYVKIGTFSMQEYLQEIVSIFNGHRIMYDFSKYIGASIINKTPHSLVDVYPRK